jgi:hypothetical protein
MSRRAASPTRSAAHAESSAPLLQPTSVFLLLLGLILAAPAAGQTVTVMGVVEDDRSGRPIGDAVVTVVGTAHTALTDPRGGFRITSIPPGSYMLRVAHVGYGEQSVRITVEVEMGPVRLKLSEYAVSLEPLTVVVLSSGGLRARGAGVRGGVVTRVRVALGEYGKRSLPEGGRG